jgi:phage shock protein C
MKKLTRNRDDKWLGGVCGGIADYTGVDANLIRLIVAVATLLGAGSLILGYLVAWILIPARQEPASAQTIVGETTAV